MIPSFKHPPELTKPNDTLYRVRNALELGGYGWQQIFKTEFLGWNRHGVEVHIIFYHDLDDKEDYGYVYIDKEGKGEF
jgi:hypothetical protein